MDIYYLDLIHRTYPKFYQDINLSHYGIEQKSTVIRKSLWSTAYSLCEMYKSKGVGFLDGIYTDKESRKFKKVNSKTNFDTNETYVWNIFFYAYEKHNPKEHSLKILYYFFGINTDMYENLFKIMKKEIFNQKYTDTIRSFVQDPKYEYLKDVFISDLVKKLT